MSDAIGKTIADAGRELRGRYSDESIDQFMTEALLHIPKDRRYVRTLGEARTPHQLVEIVELHGTEMQLKLFGTKIERFAFPAPEGEGYKVGDRLWIPMFTVAAILHFIRGWYTADQVTEIFEGVYVYPDTYEAERSEFHKFFS